MACKQAPTPGSPTHIGPAHVDDGGFALLLQLQGVGGLHKLELREGNWGSNTGGHLFCSTCDRLLAP